MHNLETSVTPRFSSILEFYFYFPAFKNNPCHYPLPFYPLSNSYCFLNLLVNHHMYNLPEFSLLKGKSGGWGDLPYQRTIADYLVSFIFGRFMFWHPISHLILNLQLHFTRHFLEFIVSSFPVICYFTPSHHLYVNIMFSYLSLEVTKKFCQQVQQPEQSDFHAFCRFICVLIVP